jgi:2'-5' RNA ligase
LYTALVLVLDDARKQLEPIREEFHPRAVASGLPLHVTLLVPFAPFEEVDEAALTDVFAAFEPFTLTLTGLASWPSIVYAVPEPRERLLAMMRALFARYPDFPPYEGKFAEPVPHATLAAVEQGASLPDVVARIHAKTEPLFPLTCEIRDVALLEKYQPDRWRERSRFSLRSA